MKFKKISAILLVAALAVGINMSFAQAEVVDLGKISTYSLTDVVDQNVKMLESGGNKIYQIKINGQKFTRDELINAHDQASRKMKNSPNYFRLWFYSDPNSGKETYYVGHADQVINSQKDFNAFLQKVKGQSIKQVTLKLNDYKMNKEYPYKDNMGLKGDYWINDTYIADGSVIRTIDSDPATLQASSKTYKVTSYKEMSSAILDGVKNLYDVITIETPVQNDKTFDAFNAFYDIRSSSPYSAFITHISVYSDSLKESKATTGKSSKITKKAKGIYTICYAYDRPKSEVKSTYNNGLTKAASINASILNNSMSPYDKVQAIHDYTVQNFSYNLPVVHFQLNDLPYHNITTILTNDGVCNGYAWSIKALLDNAGIENQVIYGTTDINDGNGDIGHAWNLVKLNGKYYHLDATWDDLDGDDNNYTYEHFLIGDALISKSHEWNRSLYPACTDNSLEYYSKNGYVVSNSDEFYRYAHQHLDSKSNMLVFKSDNFSETWIDNRFSDLFFGTHSSWKEYWYYTTESNGLITLKICKPEE